MTHTAAGGRNYYTILGLTRTATPKQIGGAFRNLARKWHPDVCPDTGDAARNFKLIAEAYEVLGDSERRRRYDCVRAGPRRQYRFARPVPPHLRQPPMRPRYGRAIRIRGLRTLLVGGAVARQTVSGTACRPGHRVRTAPRKPDLDMQAELRLSPERARRGGTVRLTRAVRAECPGCRGRRTACGGPCSTCGKTGTIRQRTGLVRIPVPPGVRTGTLIRVPGGGKLPPESVAAGDLYLRVRVERRS